MGHEKGESKAQFTCCYRCETSLGAPRMSRGPPPTTAGLQLPPAAARPLPGPVAEVPPAGGAPRPAPPAPPPALDPASLRLSMWSLAWGPQWQPRAHAAEQPTGGETPARSPMGDGRGGRGGTSGRVTKGAGARGPLGGAEGASLSFWALAELASGV